MDEVQISLRLARVAVEGLFGTARVRLETFSRIDAEGRTIIITERREPGRALVRIFTNFLIREFGDQQFQIEQVRPQSCARCV